MKANRFISQLLDYCPENTPKVSTWSRNRSGYHRGPTAASLGTNKGLCSQGGQAEDLLVTGLAVGLMTLVVVGAALMVNPTPETLHPTPYTLHPTPYTLHPTPYTLSLMTLVVVGAALLVTLLPSLLLSSLELRDTQVYEP